MVRIRKLAARDYRAVKRIERIIVDEYLAYLRETGEEDTIEPWITPEYFNHYVRAEASYVAVIARKLVGFILVQPTSFVHGAEAEVWVEFIAVQPAIGSNQPRSCSSWVALSPKNLGRPYRPYDSNHHTLRLRRVQGD